MDTQGSAPVAAEANPTPAGGDGSNPIFDTIDAAVAALDKEGGQTEAQAHPEAPAEAQEGDKPQPPVEGADPGSEPPGGPEDPGGEPPETETPAFGAESDASDDDGDVVHGNAYTVLRNGEKVRVADLKKAFGELQELKRELPQIHAVKQQLQAEWQRVQQTQAQIAQQARFFQQTVPFALQRAQADIPPEPDPSLRETDPIEYFSLKDKRGEKIAEFNKLHNAFQAQQAQAQQQTQAQLRQQQEAQQRQRAEQIAQGKQVLLKAMPDLADPQKAQSYYQRFVKTAEEMGFSKAEADNVYDPRLIMGVMRYAEKARKWDELQAQKPKVEQKAQGAAPVQAPGRRVSNAEQSAKQAQEDLARLSKSGSIEDAVALLNKYG